MTATEGGYVFVFFTRMSVFFPSFFLASICRHSRAIALEYGLYDNALFRACVTSLRWDEPTAYGAFRLGCCRFGGSFSAILTVLSYFCVYIVQCVFLFFS